MTSVVIALGFFMRVFKSRYSNLETVQCTCEFRLFCDTDSDTNIVNSIRGRRNGVKVISLGRDPFEKNTCAVCDERTLTANAQISHRGHDVGEVIKYV